MKKKKQIMVVTKSFRNIPAEKDQGALLNTQFVSPLAANLTLEPFFEAYIVVITTNMVYIVTGLLSI